MASFNQSNDEFQDEYSFREFAELPFYRKVNARLVDLSGVAQAAKIIDLGCGTGGISKLILDRIDGVKNTVIYAVDHSAAALKSAVDEIGGRKEAVVRFIHAEAQNLATSVNEQVDAVIYCNSIHYVAEKAELMRQIRERLRPGGMFAFNTSFYEGSHPPETREFYRKWMMRSLRTLKRDHGISPDKSADKSQVRRQLNVQEYSDLLIAQGFENVEVEEIIVDVPSDGWHHISGFRDWIEGVMPGVPLNEGRDALQKSLREVFAEMNIDAVPRQWLAMRATTKV